MSKAKYLVLDTETGGFQQHEPSLLSVYFMILDENLLMIDELNLLTQPDDGVYVVTGEALGVNKINLIDHSKVALTYKQAKTAIRQFLNKHNPNGKSKLIPIGHNVHFDLDFMKEDYSLGLKDTFSKYISHRVIDTGVIAQYLQQKGTLPMSVGGSLGKLVTHFKIDFPEEDRHTAKGDVIATIEVYKSLLEL